MFFVDSLERSPDMDFHTIVEEKMEEEAEAEDGKYVLATIMKCA